MDFEAGETHNLVTMSFDDDYIVPACVFLWSLKKSGACDAVEVIAGYTSTNTSRGTVDFMKRVAKRFDVRLYTEKFQEGDELNDLQEKYSVSMFARLYLAEKIPGKHLWLDIDTLLNPGWTKIFSEPTDQTSKMASDSITAVRLDSQLSLLGKEPVRDKAPWMKNHHMRGFVNAGVILWGDKERKPWKSIFKEGSALGIHQDQDLINYLYSDSISPLGVEYNFPAMGKGLASAKIIHFVGWWKPWKMPFWIRKKCAEDSCPFNEWFVAELDMLSEMETRDDSLARAYKSFRRRNIMNFGGWKTKMLVTISGWLNTKTMTGSLGLAWWKNIMQRLFPETIEHHFHFSKWTS